MICEGEGPEECKTVYESNCETSYHEHEVEDDVVDCVEEYEEKCEDVTQGMLKKYEKNILWENKLLKYPAFLLPHRYLYLTWIKEITFEM